MTLYYFILYFAFNLFDKFTLIELYTLITEFIFNLHFSLLNLKFLFILAYYIFGNKIRMILHK